MESVKRAGISTIFMMGRDLFEGGSDEGDEDEAQFLTNKDYAKSYNNIKRKELLKKFKDHQDVSSSSDSQSESDYSEDELIHNPEFDHEFLKALCSLKSKDPKIYDKKTQFFTDVEIHKPTNEAKKEKKFTLKDYERKVVVEKGGIFEDDDSDHRANQRPQSPSYVEEQERLKAEFRKVVHSDADSEEEFGGMFRQKEGSNKEKKDEEQPLNWLAGKTVEIGEDVRKSLNPLKAYWTQQNLPQQEKFLRDYIINNGYADGEEVNAVSILDNTVDCENLSEDEKELEKQAEFEHKYNFRFEEPDKEFIKRYPRTIENTVRKKDDKRKKKREETKERKEKEKKEKFKEIEMLKALKKKEIEEKIRKLKEVTGNDDLPFQDKDIEEEFDPVAHDRRMREIFNDQYYDIEEDEEKPECPDIEELKTEDWDNYDPHNDEDYYEPHCEDEDFVMDNDYDPHNKQHFQDELIENSRSTKNRRKRRNRFMEMIKAEKPPFNPEDERSYGDYIDEYYKMDCEDIIDDLPCRFKYVETIPNDFGLSIEEILLAKTKELNQWASLKKAVQIRPEYEEKKDRRLYKLKATNEVLKRKIFASLYGPQSEEGSDENDNEKIELKEEVSPNNDNTQKKKKKAKAKSAKEDSTLSHSSDHDQLKTEVKTEENETQQSNSANILQKTSEKEKSTGKQQIPDQTGILNGKKKEDKTKNKFRNEDRPSSSKKLKNQQFKTKRNPKSSIVNISKDRLKAYGINPRKFARKQRNELQKKSN